MLNINWASISTIAFEETIRSSLNEILSEIPQTVLDAVRDKFDSSLPSNPGLSSPTLSPLAGLVLSNFTFGTEASILSIPTILPATAQHVDNLLSQYNPSSQANHIKIAFPELPDHIYTQLQQYCNEHQLSSHASSPLDGIGTSLGSRSSRLTNYSLGRIPWGSVASYSYGIPNRFLHENCSHNQNPSDDHHKDEEQQQQLQQEEIKTNDKSDLSRRHLTSLPAHNMHQSHQSSSSKVPMSRSARGLLATFSKPQPDDSSSGSSSSSSQPAGAATSSAPNSFIPFPTLNDSSVDNLKSADLPLDYYNPNPLNFDTIICFDVEYCPTRSLAIALDTTLQLQSPLQLLTLAAPPPQQQGQSGEKGNDAFSSNSSFTLHPHLPQTPDAKSNRGSRDQLGHGGAGTTADDDNQSTASSSYLSSALSMAGKVFTYFTPQKKPSETLQTPQVGAGTPHATPPRSKDAGRALNGPQYTPSDAGRSIMSTPTTSTPHPKNYTARQWRAANPALLFSPERSQFVNPAMSSRQNSTINGGGWNTPSRHDPLGPQSLPGTPYSYSSLNASSLNDSFHQHRSFASQSFTLPPQGPPSPLILLPIRIGIEQINLRCRVYIILVHTQAMKDYLAQKFNTTFIPTEDVGLSSSSSVASENPPPSDLLKPVICVIFTNPDDIAPLPILSCTDKGGVNDTNTLSLHQPNTVTTDYYNPLDLQVNNPSVGGRKTGGLDRSAEPPSSASSWPIKDLKILITLGDQTNPTVPSSMRVSQVPHGSLDQSTKANRGVTITRLRAVEGFIVQRLTKAVNELISRPIVLSHDYAAKSGGSVKDDSVGKSPVAEAQPPPHQHLVELVLKRVENVQNSIIHRKMHCGDGSFQPVHKPLVQRHGLAHPLALFGYDRSYITDTAPEFQPTFPYGNTTDEEDVDTTDDDDDDGFVLGSSLSKHHHRTSSQQSTHQSTQEGGKSVASVQLSQSYHDMSSSSSRREQRRYQRQHGAQRIPTTPPGAYRSPSYPRSHASASISYPASATRYHHQAPT